MQTYLTQIIFVGMYCSIVNNYWILCNRNNNWNICNPFISAGSKTLRHTIIRTKYKVITKSSCQGHAASVDLYNNSSKTLGCVLSPEFLIHFTRSLVICILLLFAQLWNYSSVLTIVGKENLDLLPQVKTIKKQDFMQFIFLKINLNTKLESREFCYEQSLCQWLPCVVVTWIRKFLLCICKDIDFL